MFQALGNFSTLGTASVLELLMVSLPYDTERPSAYQRQAQRIADAWARAFPSEGRSASSPSLPILWLNGVWDQARSAAERDWRVGGGRTPASQSGGLILADLAFRQGDPTVSWAIVSSLLPDGPGTVPGTVPLRVALLLQRLAVELALEVVDYSSARTWLETHDRWLEWSGAVLGRSEGALLWARYHRAVGNRSLARSCAEAALAAASNPRQPLALGAAHRLLAQLEGEARRYATAGTHLERALALADACAAPFERALTLLAWAEPRADEGRMGQARALLAEVRAIGESLAARPTLAWVEALEARLAHERARPRQPAGLTPRELEVLRLVAAGLSDAEVAERLFLSPRTVGTHLTSIYGKLGVNSRTAAAHFAVEQGLV